MPEFELILSIYLGIGLSAACGFRVFVPLLGVGTGGFGGSRRLVVGL